MAVHAPFIPPPSADGEPGFPVRFDDVNLFGGELIGANEMDDQDLAWVLLGGLGAIGKERREQLFGQLSWNVLAYLIDRIGLEMEGLVWLHQVAPHGRA